MNCQKLIRTLGDFLDGNVDGELRMEINQHLAHCHDCRLLLAITSKIYGSSAPVRLSQRAGTLN